MTPYKTVEEKTREFCNPEKGWTKKHYLCECGYRGKLITETPGWFSRNGTDEICPLCRRVRLHHKFVELDEIKSFEELKRKKFKRCLDCGRINCQNADHSFQYVVSLIDVNSLEAGLKDEAISIQETFETVWNECPELKVSLYNALTRQKELLFKILGIKYQPVRSVKELRSILEGEEKGAG